MKRNNTPWQPATAAALDWTSSGDPQSRDFGDVYYSRDNGLEESRYVFLQGNDLPARWQHLAVPRFCIAETGFGTGLNFLLTWQAWLDDPAGPRQLHYLSVEKYPLHEADLRRALAAWPALAPLANCLLEQYPGLVPGQHRLVLEGGRLTLDLWWEDAAEALTDLASLGRPMVDAWYLDGFAPACNEAMWQPRLLDAVARLSRPQATFSTFTAAGAVRRQLSAAGFAVAKVAGFGRKRECLRGTLVQAPADRPQAGNTPWDLAPGAADPPPRVIVLGAGLAGCTVAAALADRGVEVTLLEQGQLAGAGSGNDQGVLYTRLSRSHSALTDFSLQSFRFSTDLYRRLFARGAVVEGVDGALCGSFHQSDKREEMALLATALATVPGLAQVLEPAQANDILGVTQTASGYWFPRSGWLRPAAVCRALVDNPGILLLENCGEILLQRSADGWQANASDGRSWEAPCAVIATGTAAARSAALSWLPVGAIRGQTTQVPATANSLQLRAALCHTGYIAPARGDRHCIGATFNLDDPEQQVRSADHSSNLARLAAAIPDWHADLKRLDPTALAGRVGFRCTSPDYLPMVGPVPDRAAFLETYAALRHNARQAIGQKGPYLPGLYLTTAHGSRGLTSTPLAAQLLASQICAEPPPLCRELSRALAPARFIIRDLSRNRFQPDP